MDWLNYHHLLYFWTVAREGSIARACERLHLAQPTVSAQIRSLETSLGERLFHRVGRGLVLTETGQVVYRYADDIFNLGRELVETVKRRPTGRPVRLAIGVTDAVPKLVAYRLIEPALRGEDRVHLVCTEGSIDRLVGELVQHRLDVVLADAPIGPGAKVKVFVQQLGDCGVSIFGTPRLAATYRPGFPRSLDGAPLLLPTPPAALRRTLDQWFDEQGIHPDVRGEFEDSALLKAFGQAGAGLFAAPSMVATEVSSQFEVVEIGRIDAIRARFHAITAERKVKNPIVATMCEAARRALEPR